MDLQEASNALAAEIVDELASRKLIVHRDPSRILHRAGWEGNTRLSQICLIIQRPKDIEYHYVKDWGKELACKLARPFEMTTYLLELPQGMHEAITGEAGPVVLRAVSDYSIQTDEVLLRFDVLVSWNDR